MNDSSALPKSILEDFKELLRANEEEQKYQAFLEQNTQLIPREFVQNHGIHFGLVLRKLSMARDYTTDFFYLSKSSTDWNGILIEIEKPSSRYFKDNSNEFHSDFTKALQQISQWRAWFAVSENHSQFFNSTLINVRVPTHMQRNPCHVKYVLVLGQRAEFNDNPHRRQLINTQERDDFKILTYDSLMEDFRNKNELYVGVRRNEFIDILSDKFLDDGIFSWMSPDALRISTKLKADILSKRDSWIHYEVNNNNGATFVKETFIKTLDTNLSRVRIRSEGDT